jgi:hypothetical protein
MRWPITVVLATIFLVSAFPAAAQPARSRMQMEIIFEPSLTANAAAQKWTKALGDLGVAGIRFRPMQNGDQITIKSEGSGDTAIYQVTALLNNRGALVTSAGQFTLSDSAKLKKWLDDVQAGGGQPGVRTVFGLSSKQFDDVKRQLSMPVGFSTKGLRPEKVIEQIRAMLKLPLAIDPAIGQALAADEPVRDEFQALSLGTSLAALARPAGGVLLPQTSGSAIGLALTAPPASGDAWPIGWPPEIKDESKIIPKLFDFTHVDIDGVPASRAIDAIASYLKVPLLFDYNSLVKQRIDLKKPVKVAPGQSYYRRILDRVLFQVGLKADVRLDDAGMPFLWITTL